MQYKLIDEIKKKRWDYCQKNKKAKLNETNKNKNGAIWDTQRDSVNYEIWSYLVFVGFGDEIRSVHLEH